VKELLLNAFSAYMESKSEIQIIALATTDGFAIATQTRDAENCPEDKMAAAASTLYSVSNAVAKQVISSPFETTFVEAVDGNMAFVSLSHEGKDYVLMMSANSQMNIANLRMLIKRLAKEILDIPN